MKIHPARLLASALALLAPLARAGWYVDNSRAAAHIGGPDRYGPFHTYAEALQFCRANNVGMTVIAGGFDDLSPEQIAAQRLAEQGQRFRAIFDLFNNKYHVPNISDLADATPPASEQELVARIDRVYREALRYDKQQFGRLTAISDEDLKLLGLLKSLPSELDDLKARLADGPAKLEAAKVQLAEVSQLASREEHIAGYLASNASSVQYDFIQTHAHVFRAVLNLLPPAGREPFVTALPSTTAEPYYVIKQPALPARVKILPQPAPLNVTRSRLPLPIAFPATVDGSIEAKLAAFKSLEEGLGYVTYVMPGYEKNRAMYRQKVADLRTQIETLQTNVAAIEDPLALIRGKLDDLQGDILDAQIKQRVSAENLLRLAAAAVIWEHVGEKIVAPALEKLVASSKLATPLKGLALLEQLSSNPAGLSPDMGISGDLKRLVETEQQVLNVEKNFESYALATADSLAAGSSKPDSELVQHIFQSLDEQGVNIMRTASGTLDGASGKIAEALLHKGQEQP